MNGSRCGPHIETSAKSFYKLSHEWFCVCVKKISLFLYNTPDGPRAVTQWILEGFKEEWSFSFLLLRDQNPGQNESGKHPLKAKQKKQLIADIFYVTTFGLILIQQAQKVPEETGNYVAPISKTESMGFKKKYWPYDGIDVWWPDISCCWSMLLNRKTNMIMNTNLLALESLLLHV